MTSQKRKQNLVPASRNVPVGNERGQLRTIFQIPFHPRDKFRQMFDYLQIRRLDGEKWNQSDGGLDFQRQIRSVRQTQMIVIKLVGFVPQPKAVLAYAVDG